MAPRVQAKSSVGGSIGDADPEECRWCAVTSGMEGKVAPEDTKVEPKNALDISKASYQATASNRILRFGHKREPSEAD